MNDPQPGLGLEPVSYNLDAELAVIGALLLHGPEALDPLDALDPDDLSPDNASLLSAAVAVAEAHHWPDHTLLAAELGPEILALLGGDKGLIVRCMDAQAAAPVLTSVGKYADIVRSTAQARRLQATALELARNPTNGHATELVDRLTVLRDNRAARRINLTPATDVELARPHWVWDQRIPVGGVTLMAGREGHGKTLLVCWLAARITRGQLPGERRGHPADVVYVGLEDDRSTVIKPRLIAAGTDPDRFHFVDLADETFALDRHLGDLADALEPLDVGLIVIDPLDAHLGHVDSHKKGEVQAAIGQLAALTQHHRCGALGLAHFNKNTGLNDLLTRIAGSAGFSTAVRSVLAIGPHPADDNDRLCLLAKANMTSKTDVAAIRFRIEAATVTKPGPDHQAEEIATATVALIGEEDGHNPDQLLSPADPEQRTMLEDAIDWLHSLLAHQPQPRADINRLAAEEGITPKTLRTARERLGVIVERDPTTRGRPSLWRLPTTREPPHPELDENVPPPDYEPTNGT